MSDVSDVERRLILNTAAEVRLAISKRAEDLQEPLAKYDIAMAGDDPEEKFAACVMLALSASVLMDPVATAVRKFSELSALLKEMESS